MKYGFAQLTSNVDVDRCAVGRKAECRMHIRVCLQVRKSAALGFSRRIHQAAAQRVSHLHLYEILFGRRGTAGLT